MKQNNTLFNIKAILCGICILLFTMPETFGQLDVYLNNMDSTQNYYNIQNKMYHYLDSLETTMDSSTFYAGGGAYKEFKKFKELWEPRVNLHGDFSKFFDVEHDFYTTFYDDYNFYTDTNWLELGPNRMLETNDKKGIGPTEFITFYDNGTDDSTHIILTGSTAGGLFYSTDTANTWNSTGTDNWPSSGCISAIFHPYNHNVWYAASSGGESAGSSWIRKTGGVRRTVDEGQTWEQIADHADLGGSWTIIYKLLINPENPNVLFAATNLGLYRTLDCNDQNPTWQKVLTGKIFDIESRPECDSVFYAAVYNGNNSIWEISLSNQYGDSATWFEMQKQPDSLTNEDIGANRFTLEVSKAKPGYLYAATRDTSIHKFYYYNFDTVSEWEDIGQFNNYSHGDGHGFGVEQVLTGEEIMAAKFIWVEKYDFDGNSDYIKNMIHVDIEDVVYHPYHANEVWICTHGGVEVSYDNGDNWQARYNGLGLAQVEKFATSYTNPEYIMTGLYHDGTKLSLTEYGEDWNPDWKYCAWWDGQKPLIDNKNPGNMWASGQTGAWWYSQDTFNTTGSYSWLGTNFDSEGALNKVNPDVLYRNVKDISNPVQEDIYRSSTGENKFISSFKTFFPDTMSIIITGVFTPYTDGDYLLVTLIERYGNPSNDKFYLFRTTNANDAWDAVVWEQLYTPRIKKTSLASVEFDPYNPDIVYLSYTKPVISSTNIDSLIFKIDYSDLNNTVCMDITYNLPETIVSYRSIETNRRSNGGIFLATEFGIFYTNNNLMENNGNEWQQVGTKFPHVRCRGIEINYPSNTLRVGTFGRGIWELPLPPACQFNQQTLTITSDTTWNTFVYLDRSVVVDSGAVLTINPDALVAALSDAKITIKPGAKIILNGGTLTNACMDKWQGIEVWGNPNASQSAANQGTLEIINGGTISHAEVAVRVGSEGNKAMGGGRVYATDAIFTNNDVGVWFDPYSLSTDNVSWFETCEFDYTSELPGGIGAMETFTFVKLDNVDRVLFAGCSFTNNSNLDYAGIGILSTNSICTVEGKCTNPWVSPCNAWNYGTFDSLRYAIYATAANSTDFTDIRHTTFTNNHKGIYLSGITLPRITSNEFYLKGTAANENYGLYLDECSDYWVEDNFFERHNSQSGKKGIGIVVNESGRDPNEVYRNTFDNVEYGILAQGLNLNTKSGEGLVCKCNTFTNGAYDIAVTAVDGSQGMSTYGIAQYQGSSAGQADAPAGNRFSWTGPEGTYTDINNLGLHFYYYYHVNGQYHLKPKYYDTLKVTAVPNYWANWDSTSCISYLNTSGGGGSSEESMRSLLNESTQASDSLNNLIQALEDAGNTEALEWTVDMSLPEQSFEVYNQLMNTAPYISDTVLEAAIEKEDVLPDAMLRDVMVASPESATDDYLIEKLDERTKPMPAYMLGQILQGRSLVSVYGDLLAQKAQQSELRTLALKQLKHLYYANTSNTAASLDSLESLLSTQNSLNAKYNLAFLYLQQNDSAAATDVLSQVPIQFALDEEQELEHNLLVGYINLIQQQDDSLPDSTDQDMLYAMATDGNGIARVYARNILLSFGAIEYNEPILLPENTKSALAEDYRQLIMLAKNHETLQIQPNPARDFFITSWNLDKAVDNLTLKLSSLDGEIVMQEQVSGKINQHVMDTRKLQTGIYIVSLHSQHQLIDSKKVSIIK